jgi:hypothetical protein
MQASDGYVICTHGLSKTYQGVKGPARALEKRIDATLDLVGLNDKGDRPIRAA